jgi:hypothetical protein
MVELDGCRMFGKLDSQPIIITELKVGQALAVSYNKIREHRRFNVQ